MANRDNHKHAQKRIHDAGLTRRRMIAARKKCEKAKADETAAAQHREKLRREAEKGGVITRVIRKLGSKKTK